MVSRIMILMLFLNLCLFSLPFQDEQPPSQDKEILELGSLNFPRPFIHKESDYPKGAYKVNLVWKEDEPLPYFRVYDKDNKLLLEELALIIPRKGKAGSLKYRIKKMLVNGAEHFMIRVTRPDQYIYAFFLVNKEKK